jgi:hypothetical protein
MQMLAGNLMLELVDNIGCDLTSSLTDLMIINEIDSDPLAGKVVKVRYANNAENFIYSVTSNPDGYFGLKGLNKDSTFLSYAQDIE